MFFFQATFTPSDPYAIPFLAANLNPTDHTLLLLSGRSGGSSGSSGSGSHYSSSTANTKKVDLSRRLGQEMQSLVTQIKEQVATTAADNISSIRRGNVIQILREITYVLGFMAGVS